jgi:hypothetical protein
MTAPSSFFKPSAAEHGAVAATSVCKMAMADSITVVVDVSAGVVVGGQLGR